MHITIPVHQLIGRRPIVSLVCKTIKNDDHGHGEIAENLLQNDRRGFSYGLYLDFSEFSSMIAYIFPVVILGAMQLGWVCIYHVAPLSVMLGMLALFVADRPQARNVRGLRSIGRRDFASLA